jgi:hypothetical protein
MHVTGKNIVPMTEITVIGNVTMLLVIDLQLCFTQRYICAG